MVLFSFSYLLSFYKHHQKSVQNAEPPRISSSLYPLYSILFLISISKKTVQNGEHEGFSLSPTFSIPSSFYKYHQKSVRSFELRSLLSRSTLRCFYPKRKRGVKNFHPSLITSYPCPDPSLALVVLLELVCQLQQPLLLIIMLKQMQHFVMQNVLLLLGPRYLLQSCLPIHL